MTSYGGVWKVFGLALLYFKGFSAVTSLVGSSVGHFVIMEVFGKFHFADRFLAYFKDLNRLENHFLGGRSGHTLVSLEFNIGIVSPENFASRKQNGGQRQPGENRRSVPTCENVSQKFRGKEKSVRSKFLICFRQIPMLSNKKTASKNIKFWQNGGWFSDGVWTWNFAENPVRSNSDWNGPNGGKQPWVMISLYHLRSFTYESSS